MPFNWDALAPLAGLASGNTVGEQFGNVNALRAAQAPLIQQRLEQNKTLAYLDKFHPDIAAQVKAGMPMASALTQVAEARKPKSLAFQKLDDGRYGTFDESTGTLNILGTAQKPEDPTSIQRDLMAAGLQPGTPEYQRAILEHYRKSGMMIEQTADGFRFVQGDVDTKMPKLTEAEGKNAGFYIRAKESNNLLTAVEPPKNLGDQPMPALENEGTSERNRFADNLPVVGNYVRSTQGQKYQQAKDNFITAVLRKESGAVIGDAEYAREDRKYFPQPGEGPEVIEQKRRARELAIEGLKIGSGPAKLDGGDDPLGIR